MENKTTIKVTQMIPVDLELELDYKDILNWLNNCKCPITLRSLGDMAHNLANLIDAEENEKEEPQDAEAVCSE